MVLKKARLIVEWPTFEVRSFHGLVSFQRKFVRNFSGICAPFNESTSLQWNVTIEKSFELLKKKG
jgi:hypothetical protein